MKPKEVVLIAGGSGMVGKALCAYLKEHGYDTIVLTRTSDSRNMETAHWDPASLAYPKEAFSKADFVVNLAGANVADKRWSNQRKKEILESRTQSGETIARALRETPNHVKAVVNASAIGWYGPDLPGHAPFVESDPPATGTFLGDTCVAWEDSIAPVTSLGIRLAIARIGIVLSTKSGALPEFMKPIKMGVAAVLGSGDQMISWIHIHDLCALIRFLLERPDLSGPFNAAAPTAISNRHMTLAIAKIMRGNFFLPIPVPTFVLKMMLGEMSVEVLKSTRVSSRKIALAGFQFRYPDIENALGQLLHKS